tara:strand:+ start:4081 stop:4266 length:186 start_codon:yes stop_codon:yes gene_type:complete
MKTINVTIDTDGNIEVETSGFAGAECKKATADLERQLGKVTDDAVTPEYHKRPVTTIKARS